MRLSSAAFVLLLVGAHGVGDLDQRLGQPLSVFRDGAHGWLGYLLFASLLAIGWRYTTALVRAGEEDEAVSGGLATLLLFVVAVTPSFNGFHLLCSFALLLLLFVHYGRLLRDSGSPWFVLHVLAPLALALASGSHSYGLWQKSLILYVVVLANVRHHLLGQRRPGRQPYGRRMEYRLEAGPTWVRRSAR